MGLAKVGQDDFSAGSYTEQPFEKVPTNGVSDLLEGLIGDDGLPFRRGGATTLSDTNKASGYFFWRGWLAVGERVLWGDNTGALWTLNGSTPQAVPNDSGSAGAYSGKAAVLNGMVILPDGTIWGGSYKTSNYNTGTMDMVMGSDQVVGHGTAWLANLDPGMLFQYDRVYVIKSIQDDTHLTLATPSTADATLENYVAAVYRSAASGSIPAGMYASAGNRLFALQGNRIYESNIGDPQSFAGFENSIDLPAGVRILGAEGLRDQLLVFTTGGMFVLSNVALDLEDPDGNVQQRLELVNSELILWSWEGVASWRNALIVPATDGVYVLDAISAPQRISEGIQIPYERQTAFGTGFGYGAGYSAVYRGHYFLPIRDNGGVNEQVLVCRLTPTRRGRGDTAFAWSRFKNKIAAVAPWQANNLGNQVKLIGVNVTNNRIETLKWFDPTTATEADGTAHVMELVTREYEVGGVHTALVRSFLSRYELTNAGGTSTLSLAYSIDGGAFVTVAGAAPEATLADKAYLWKIDKRAHGIRFRIRTTGAATKALLHMLEASYRPSGRVIN